MHSSMYNTVGFKLSNLTSGTGLNIYLSTTLENQYYDSLEDKIDTLLSICFIQTKTFYNQISLQKEDKHSKAGARQPAAPPWQLRSATWPSSSSALLLPSSSCTCPGWFD